MSNITPELSYEEARDQLVAVVRELESGNVPVSKSMQLWERGEHLAAICQRWLDGARETIRRAQEDAPGADRATDGDEPGAGRGRSRGNVEPDDESGE